MSQLSDPSHNAIQDEPKSSQRQNGRASADLMKDLAMADLSNGFEARSAPKTRPRSETQEIQKASAKSQLLQDGQQQLQPQPKHAEDSQRSASVPVVLAHQAYHDNLVIDRVQFVSQGPPVQPIPVHASAAPYVPPEYVIAAPDSLQYSQLHGALYNPAAAYVSRDSGFRESSLYGPNVAIAAVAPGAPAYIQQQPGQGQPGQAAFFANKALGLPTSVAAGYVHFGQQIHYSQYPQTVVNAAPYPGPTAGQKSMYPPQQYPVPPSQQQVSQTSSAQHSPNPQRYSQEMSQYPQVQPIGAERVSSRGPKPMVPPRVNSKITHEAGHRKSASVDTGHNGKTKEETSAADGQLEQSQSANQNSSRTRQDGLYGNANGDGTSREQQGNDVEGAERNIYVSRNEHRKSISVDVTSGHQRRNDTITFTFPSDASAQQDSMLPVTRQPVVTSSNVPDHQPIDGIGGANLSLIEQKRLDMSAGLRMSPMPVLPAAVAIVPKGILVNAGERKSVEWSTLSPNQRVVLPQENRRSDYFEEHRRSPMTVETGKRFEEVRRSPMAFVPIRDTGVVAERANQKSPNSSVAGATQNFEKTRAELAMWAEQRQRQEIETRMITQPSNRDMYVTTSPRSRNQSEERRLEPSRNFVPSQIDKTDPRLQMAPSAFQPIASITPTTIMEQRRHLRHVSADLTKHLELSRKEFDDQLLGGSVSNLGVTPPAPVMMAQRANPSVPGFQYEPKPPETKVPLTIVTDFSNEIPSKPLEQVDHIIHSSHRRNNTVAPTVSRSHHDGGSQGQSVDLACNDKSNDGHHLAAHSQIFQQNQQSIDFISEKLSQCEKQQSDLQAKLQSLQSQNEILDKVAQYQYQQNDLQTRLHNLHLQNQLAERLSQRQSSEFSQSSSSTGMSHDEQDQTNKSILNQCINASRQLYSHQSLLNAVGSQQLQAAAYMGPASSERVVSPRLQFQQMQDESDLAEAIQIPNISQMPLPSLSQFDRADVLARASYAQLQRMHQQQQANDKIIDPGILTTSSQVSLTSVGNATNFTGALKKVPPEKPPRTSLIAQSPDTESNRSQPAIGLKHTSKARRKRKETGARKMDDSEIQSTVESILGPDVKIIDCEKKSCVKEEEVLLINGVPITLDEPDGAAMREAMITGQVPPCDLLNRILIRAGIQRVPVRLETSLNVKSSIITKEEVTVARDGKVVDERSRETKENNCYSSTTSEIWEPIGVVHRPRNLKPFDSSDESRPNSNASSDQGYTTNTSTNNVLRERGGFGGGSGGRGGGTSAGGTHCSCGDVECSRGCLSTTFSGLGLSESGDDVDADGSVMIGSPNNGVVKVPRVTGTNSAPTIFGTVASDLNPKDGNSRRSLPQTPAGSLAAKALAGGNGAGGPSTSVMVNGSDHRDPRDIAEQHELVYRDGNLVSGSLEALVQHMVPTEEYYPDRAYLFAFLLSARLFIKPHELLGEVCALCEHQQNLNGEGGKERLHRFVPRLVQLLAEWTETFPYDFRDERVMGHVRSITQKVANVDAAARQEVSVLLQNLLVKLTALERYEEALTRLANDSTTESLSQVDVTELCPSATVLAQQLTHIELERLSYIGPEEFVQAFAKESPHLETSFKDMKKTRNLESYVQWFNRLSYFVATEVCKHAKKKQRVRVVEYWIETARECFNIGNFNSLMAIIAGLNMSPISRLKKTWSKVQQAKFSILEHQMDPSSNFSSYRSTLKAAMWRSAGATDERQRIVVPFFSLLVKDLYFLNEGCSNKLPNGHINFDKFWQLAKQVTEFIAWKQVACPFEKNPRVIAFLQASPVLTENALALASFECEPPDNHEKERYKALKSELSGQ